jgi:1-acyl-sn-glycerol-3-phosphate acyltransferase
MKDDSKLPLTRAVLRMLILLGTSAHAGLSFFVRRVRRPIPIAERAQWLHESCRLALDRLGIEIVRDGRFPPRGLLVSNHLSYLDILVFSAVSPAIFVSKKEVRAWPLYGWLARLAGTIFVNRTLWADAHQANLRIGRALSEGSVVVLFPEGTSSDGTAVLPFRSTLLDAAIKSQEPISSAHISYTVENGSVEKEICYWGTMSFVPHLLRLMSLRGIRAQVRFAPEAQRFEDRKVAASATRKLVLTLGNVRRESKEVSRSRVTESSS